MPSIPASRPPGAQRASLTLIATFAAVLATALWVTATTPAAGASREPAATVTVTKASPLETNTPTATPAADISVDKSGPGTGTAGQVIVYTIDLTNNGPLSTTATVTDTLSSDVTWLTTTSGSGVTCTGPTSNNIVCAVASISNSTTRRVVTITVQIDTGLPVGTTIVNLAQARSPLDPVISQDTVTTIVQATPTPSPTPTGSVATPDAAECNNDFDHAYRLSVGQSMSSLNFVPPAPGSCGPLPIGSDDVDYFKVHAKDDDWFQGTTSVSTGIDTYLRLYDQDFNLVAENDDYFPGSYSSQITWKARYDGDYYFQITNVDPAQIRGAIYSFSVTALASAPTPTPTNTPAPGPTPVPGLDLCEPNYDFEHACVVAPGAPKSGMNFVSPDPNAPDNDFYALWQKPGLQYICRTADLTPGMDTNMIVYNQDGQGVDGNDDCEVGDFSSCVDWVSTYTGWVYFVVGSVVQPAPSSGTYTFSCSAAAPTTPTPTPSNTPRPTVPFPIVTSTYPPPPTQPFQPTLTPLPPPTSTPPIIVIPLPTPTPGGQTSQVVRVDLQIYYDANNNEEPDAGEGVIGVRAQLVDAAGNVIDSRVTSATGTASLSGVVTGDVFLEVPYFNVRVPISGPRTVVQIRIVPQPLPGSVP